MIAKIDIYFCKFSGEWNADIYGDQGEEIHYYAPEMHDLLCIIDDLLASKVQK